MSKLDLRTDNMMNILGDMMDIFEETNQDIVKWVDRAMQHIMNIRVMFESVDTKLDDVEMHRFKTLMLDVLDKYISNVRAEAYECSIVVPSSLPDYSMSLGGGTMREQSQVPEEEEDSGAGEKVVAVCREKGEHSGSYNIPAVFDKTVEDHGDIERYDDPYSPDQEMEEMVSQVIEACIQDSSCPKQAYEEECEHTSECEDG